MKKIKKFLRDAFISYFGTAIMVVLWVWLASGFSKTQDIKDMASIFFTVFVVETIVYFIGGLPIKSTILYHAINLLMLYIVIFVVNWKVLHIFRFENDEVIVWIVLILVLYSINSYMIIKANRAVARKINEKLKEGRDRDNEKNN